MGVVEKSWERHGFKSLNCSSDFQAWHWSLAIYSRAVIVRPRSVAPLEKGKFYCRDWYWIICFLPP